MLYQHGYAVNNTGKILCGFIYTMIPHEWVTKILQEENLKNRNGDFLCLKKRY
jgi:hypothetical protein